MMDIFITRAPPLVSHLLLLHRTPHGMGHPFGQFGSAALGITPPHLLPSLLALGVLEALLVLCQPLSAIAKNLVRYQGCSSYSSSTSSTICAVTGKLTPFQPDPLHLHSTEVSASCCLDRTSCVPVCVQGQDKRQWAPLKRAWLHPLCMLPSGICTC